MMSYLIICTPFQDSHRIVRRTLERWNLGSSRTFQVDGQVDISTKINTSRPDDTSVLLDFRRFKSVAERFGLPVFKQMVLDEETVRVIRRFNGRMTRRYGRTGEAIEKITFYGAWDDGAKWDRVGAMLIQYRTQALVYVERDHGKSSAEIRANT